MKTVGITGPPGAGKTTLWRAVTGGQAKGAVAAMAVPDPRLDTLVHLHGSRRRVAAQIEVIDAHASARTEAAALAALRELDAILIVCPWFTDQDPTPALRSTLDHLLLADMGPIETRLERARKDPAARKEVPTLEAALHQLGAGCLLRDHSWEAPDLQVFSPLAPITLKPLVVVWNVDEQGLTARPPEAGPLSFVVCAALEAEVAGLDAQEARPLLEAYGVGEPALGRVIAALYRSLDLITFFTTSEKESRAWEVRRGAGAPEAAGVIHTDMQRGFIRAEVVGFDRVVEAGSWDAAKARGWIRVEGKDYMVAEGDVIHFRFAV